MASSNTAFCFDIVDGTQCYSQQNVVCKFDDGAFIFDGYRISVGNSYENNYGGIGGFVGPNHEYFVYCGSKYAEIAIARYNRKKDIWENWACQQWENDGTDSEDCLFKHIWIAKDGLALIFQPRADFRRDLLRELTGDETMKAIRFDLIKCEFFGLTNEDFREQKHVKIDHNSDWPFKTDGESSIGSDTTLYNGSSKDHGSFVTYLKLSGWDIHHDPEERTFYGVDSEEQLFDEPVLLELPNATGTIYYRVAVHKGTVKATLKAIYRFYKHYERVYNMGNVTCIQSLEQAEIGNPYLWRLKLQRPVARNDRQDKSKGNRPRSTAANTELLMSERDEWEDCDVQLKLQNSEMDDKAYACYQRIEHILKTATQSVHALERSSRRRNLKAWERLQKYRVLPVQQPSYNDDIIFEDLDWDFREEPSTTVLYQELKKYFFDSPVLLQLEDIKGEDLGVVILYGRTGEAILNAVYNYYYDHQPYKNQDDLADDIWSIGLVEDKHGLWKVSLVARSGDE